jgi:transposase
MPKKYSNDMKWRIVYLWNDGYSIEKISKFLYVSEKTIYRVLNYYILWKDVKDPVQDQKGQRKVFNNSDMKVCIIYYQL